MKKKKTYNLKEINENLLTDPRKQILDTESRYRGQLFVIADKIVADRELKLVLMAGPSCAGKTTSARLLKEILESKGKDVVTISLDDFFIDRDKTPLLPNGQKDFDSPRALDTELMKECFTELFKGRKTGFPIYDFVTGKNIKNHHEPPYSSALLDSTTVSHGSPVTSVTFDTLADFRAQLPHCGKHTQGKKGVHTSEQEKVPIN